MDWVEEQLGALFKKRHSLRGTLFLYLLLGIFFCVVASLVTIAVIVTWEKLLLDVTDFTEGPFAFLWWQPSSDDFVSEKLARQINLLELLRNLAPFLWGLGAVLWVTERFYQRKIKEPLELLQKQVAYLGAGEFSRPVEVYTNDDFEILATSFEALRRDLVQQQQEIQELHLEQKKINAAFSHDLRTPLAVIQNNGELLAEILPEDHPLVQKALSKIQNNVTRLTNFSQTMQEIQRLEEMPLEKKAVSQGTFSHDLEELLEAFPQIALSNQLFQSGRLNIDCGAVMEAFENVLYNASRYSNEKITVTVRKHAGFLELVVKDDGPGFTKEALDSATDPYYSQQKENHFGLGLTIADVLTRKHGGVLKIGNGVEGGAVVTLVFAC